MFRRPLDHRSQGLPQACRQDDLSGPTHGQGVDLGRAFLWALWLFLPCYCANMVPVAAARLWPRWSAPLDGGALARDGKRLLGPNKTWRGLTAGIVTGALVTVILGAFAAGLWAPLDFGRSSGAAWWQVAAFGGALGIGALAGDAAKSYFKRRTGRDSGAAWFPWDQLDFVVGGLALAAVASPLLGGWAIPAYFGDAVVLATLVVMTPALHFASSVLAYWGGLKKVPW